ncbi:MAG: polyamine aminopropyltransferase [Magnetospiraceae bacterium]
MRPVPPVSASSMHRTDLQKARLKDAAILLIMMVLAGAGLIYEYLLSHYAGRVIGLMEHAIFTMIGVMIVSMGVGALAAKRLKDPETAFVVLELAIALIGATAVLMIAGMFAFVAELPRLIAANFGMPFDAVPHGGLSHHLETWAKYFPYVAGFVLGAGVGMEIPLIARVRERLYQAHLEHNTGTVYGLDYIGAGVGAAIFVAILLAVPPERAALWVAAANLTVGLAFLILRWRHVRHPRLFAGAHGLIGLFLLFLSFNVADWRQSLENLLYEDRVIFSKSTDFQHITLTERRTAPDMPAQFSLFLNGRLQFCTCDEAVYHAMLVGPPLLASARNKDILVIGGGDGMAVRDILRWHPDQVTVLELDQQMIRLFSEPVALEGRVINERLLEISNRSFKDPRVQVILGDAYNSIDQILREGKRFDTIIVDLPDPSHPNLNKLYSARFYAKLRQALAGDGAIAIQSTSPYHARDAFLTVGVTLEAAGFGSVERYHANVPSFGEWGWTIAVPQGRPASQRLAESTHPLPSGFWATKSFLKAAYEFPEGFLAAAEGLEPNTLGSHRMYLLHQKAWGQREIKVTGAGPVPTQTKED